jgi:hypothetical protein
LWRIMVTVPATAALVLLVGMLPVNASPSSPLHALHELIFSNDGPTPTDQIRAEIAGATAALDHAGACGSDRYSGALDQAGHHIANAHRVLSTVEDTDVRERLRSQLSALERRADEMASCGSDDQGGPGQDQDQDQDQDPGKDDAKPNTPGSEDDQGDSHRDRQSRGSEESALDELSDHWDGHRGQNGFVGVEGRGQDGDLVGHRNRPVCAVDQRERHGIDLLRP